MFIDDDMGAVKSQQVAYDYLHEELCTHQAPLAKSAVSGPGYCPCPSHVLTIPVALAASSLIAIYVPAAAP